jgi:la-related protein 1
MVSPTPSSPTKVPHLSYADHAKKAQNIKSSISTQPHRIVLQSLPSTSDILASSSDQLVSPSKSVPGTPAVDVKSDSGANLIRYTDSRFHSPSSTDTSNVKTINSDPRANSDLAEKALSVVAAHTSSQKSPVVNVWNVRKQQLAAARAALTTALAKDIPWESQAVSLSSELTSQSTLPSISTFKSSSAPAPNTSHGPSAMTNGVTSTSQKAEHDPFVVRTGVRTMKPLPPPVDDTDSWPEVGKSAAFTQPNANVVTRVDDSVTHNESEGDQVSTTMSRKSASISA